MSNFNLLEEPWISVLSLDSGQQEDVSVVDLFRHARHYKRIAGDTPTQDFAVLRMLLAVLQTVFSRYDAEGSSLVPVDEMMRQTGEIVDYEDARDEYEDALRDTWKSIWEKGIFPEILFNYLDIWKDHFYLLDETCPFYQVTESVLADILPKGKKPSLASGRFMNRTISESGNKTALFSPRTDTKETPEKDVMSYAQLARWLITFQGYTGLSDKASAVKKGQNPSKGWLYDLGGIYLSGDNFFETLLLNYIPVHPMEIYRYTVQKPCWELSPGEVVHRLVWENPIVNISELYTNWSRAIYLDPETNLPGPVAVQIVKLPAIMHTDQFLEPMTIWKYNESGDNKGHFTPKKHIPQQAMWRSFGLVALPTSAAEKQIRPGIQDHLDHIRTSYGSRLITVCAVSMQDDGNATSWVPVDEITDELCLNDLVLTDDGDEGWIIRINDTVCQTKKVVDEAYREFLRNVAKIRNMDDVQTSGFLLKGVQALYQEIDLPFRNWMQGIMLGDSKEQAIIKWRKVLKDIVIRSVQEIVFQSGDRDLTGVEDGGHILNIATAYLSFLKRIKQMLA